MADAAGDRQQQYQHYPYVWFTVAGLLALGAIVSVTLLFSEGYRYAQAVGVVCASLSAVTVASTLVSMRLDRHRRSAGKQMDGITDAVGGVAGAVVEVVAEMRSLRRFVEARAEQVEEVAAYHMAIEGQKAQHHATSLFDRSMKEMDSAGVFEISERLDGLRAQVEARIGILAEQQETLADMVANGTTLTLDVANGDVYELGKSVGRDEVLRELGKDQIP